MIRPFAQSSPGLRGRTCNIGFIINAKREPSFRQTLTARDYEYLKNCRVCKHKEICGGWNTSNDARWCVGPGEVCFDGEWTDENGKLQIGCRAICSRCPEKVEEAALCLGEGNYSIDEETGVITPDLSIVGKHAWQPWSFDAWPHVGFQINAHVEGLHQDLYTISLKHLYYPERGTWSPQKDLRARFQIPDTARVAITMTTHDHLLDQLAEDLDDFAFNISEFEGVDFVFAPNFSVYGNYPRLDALFQIKRKWVSLELFQNYGLKVVPDICFSNSADYKNQIAWMHDNKCNIMLINYQVQAVTAETKQWMALIKAAMMVRDALGWPIQLIAYGATGRDRMESVAELYPSVTFIDSKAYRLAEYHKDLNLVVDKSIPVKALFAKNCEQSLARILAAKKAGAERQLAKKAQRRDNMATMEESIHAENP